MAIRRNIVDIMMIASEFELGMVSVGPRPTSVPTAAAAACSTHRARPTTSSYELASSGLMSARGGHAQLVGRAFVGGFELRGVQVSWGDG